MMLRPVRPGDAEAVAETNNLCWKAAYRHVLPDEALDAIGVHDRVATWRRWAVEKPEQFIVAVDDDDQVVGFITVEPHADGEPFHVGEILSIYVHPDHWRRGAGRLLLDCGCRLLADAGCTEAVLSTFAAVPDTQAFYEAQGWAPDGTSFEHEDTTRSLGPVELIRMRRPLGRDDEVVANRRRWDAEADWYAEVADRGWEAPEPSWGMFNVPESVLGAMPDVAGKDVVELGCGTAYVSSHCLKAGARAVVGVDNSPGQLATAAEMATTRGASDLMLVHADANRAPLRDRSFDVAINEYGAAIWCDPHKWIPEASRLLRDGGLLWFLGNSVIQMLTLGDYEGEDTGPVLRRPQRGMHRFTWPDDDGVEYHISHGDMIRLLGASELDVVDLIEVYTEPDADTRYHYADADWGSRWPVEEIWVARRRARARVHVVG